MELIDTHCHLVSPKLKDSVPEILERAIQAGVSKIINIAYDPQSVMLGLEQLALSPMLYLTLGIQPHDAHSFTIEEGAKIKQLARANKRVVGIGEIGLDAYYTLSPMEKQIECFEYFLEVALELNLPVVVHVRETHDSVYSRLLPFSKKGGRGVIHCFTGSQSECEQFLDCGFYISFSGIATFKSAQDLQKVAQYVPNERILIETDSPYLSPMPLRGKTNEPAHIVHTCEFIAALRGQTKEDFAKLTVQNSMDLFKLND